LRCLLGVIAPDVEFIGGLTYLPRCGQKGRPGAGSDDRPGKLTTTLEPVMTREELVSGLVRIGERELTGDDEAEVDAYFAPGFSFHGPDGRELDYQGLKGYFTALRAAFDDLTITRGIVVVEGDYVACQTTIAGTFVREFTHSPVGTLPPNGNRVVFELMNLFRYDDAGRLAEEWIQTDNRSVLRQLGAEGL
jgi:predicted ester cyclase